MSPEKHATIIATVGNKNNSNSSPSPSFSLFPFPSFLATHLLPIVPLAVGKGLSFYCPQITSDHKQRGVLGRVDEPQRRMLLQ